MYEKFMKIAIEEADKGLEQKAGGPFGAIIVLGDEIVGRGHNTVLKDGNPTHHAEINAISDACTRLKTIDLSNCVIYSTVEPCPMCLSAIHWSKIPVVVYGASIADAKEAGFNEISFSDDKFNKSAKLNISLKSGVLRVECMELFKRFKEKEINTY